MTALDCVLSCFGENTCKSFNYAEPTSVNDGEGNCELHNETKNDDENSLQFLKDDRYTFYQIARQVSILINCCMKRRKSLSSPHSCHFCNQGSCNKQFCTYNFQSCARLTKDLASPVLFLAPKVDTKLARKNRQFSFSTCRSHF